MGQEKAQSTSLAVPSFAHQLLHSVLPSKWGKKQP